MTTQTTRTHAARAVLAGVVGALLLLAAPAVAQTSVFVLSDPESDVYQRFVVAAGEQIQVEENTLTTGNVHSNDKIDLKPGSNVVGDVSAVGDITTDGTVSGSVQPGAPAEILPLIDEVKLRLLADRILSGDQVLTDATVDDVLFVEGKVEVFGSLEGIGTIIATAEINLIDSGVALSDSTWVSLISFKHIEVGKDRRLRAALRAKEFVIVEERADVEGVVVADKEVIVKKDATVTFRNFGPPEITIASPADGSIVYERFITVTGTVADAHLQGVVVNGVEATVSEGAWTAAGVPVEAGWTTITATATDLLGRTTAATVSVQFDTEPPVVTIDQPATGPDECLRAGQLFTVGGSFFDLSAGDDPLALQIYPSGGTPGPRPATLLADATAWTAADVDLGTEDGTATATLTATDSAGNTSRVSRSWRLDAHPPTVELTLDGDPFPGAAAGETPPPDAVPVLFGRTLAPRVLVGDGALTAPAATLTLDGDAYVQGTPITVEGDHLLVATATDCAGHTTTTHAFFHLDLSAPQLVTTNPADGALVGEPVDAYHGTADGELADATVGGQPAAVDGVDFTLTPFPWREGENTVEIELADAAGNRASFVRGFTVRSIPPTVELRESGLPIQGGALYTRPVRPTVHTNHDDNTVEATLNGAAFASGTEIAATGDYTLSATATDPLGRPATASVSFRVDLEPGPTIAILSPADGATLPDATVDVSGSVTGSGVGVTVNGVAASVAGGSFSVAGLPLDADVVNQVVAVARDAAGRTASDTITVMVRSAGPRVLILEPADGLVTNRSRIDVAGVVLGGAAATADGTVTVAGRTVALEADGDWRALDVPLVEGANLITATAIDPQGRSGEATITVVADLTPPRVLLEADGRPLEDGASFGLPPLVRIEVTDNAGEPPPPEIRLNGGLEQVTSPVHEIQITADGGYLVAVAAADAAGNETRVERSFIVGGGGCTLSEIEPASGAAVAGDSITIRGRGGAAATITIRVPVPGSDPVAYQDFPAAVADGTFVAGDVPLPAVGENAVDVVCAPTVGEPVIETVVIERLPDGAGPVIRITIPGHGDLLGTETVLVRGTVDQENVTVTVAAAPATVTPQGDGSAEFSNQTLLVEGPNILTARAVDAVGRRGRDRVVVTRDTTPPRVQITDPTSGASLGPAGGGTADVDVSGLVDLDAEPHLESVVVATAQGTVTADVEPATGAFFAADVPLDPDLGPELAQTITVTATDVLGHAGSSSVDVHFDATGPAIVLSSPADLSHYDETADTIAIHGEAWAQDGARISVNGSTLDPAGLSWSEPDADGRRHLTFTVSMTVPAEDGGFRVVAVVTEVDGRDAMTGRLLYRDGTPPEVVEMVPADGTTGVVGDSLLLVLFSEPIRHSTLRAADGLTLTRLATGESVVGQIEVAGNAVAFAPGAELAAGEAYRFRAGADVTDLVGHPLVAVADAVFEVAAADLGAAPRVDPIPSPLCASRLEVTGDAAPAARVRVRDGDLVFTAVAGNDGRFLIDVPLAANGYHLLHVDTVDHRGSRGAETAVLIRVDCSSPEVRSASLDRDAGVVRLLVSEPVDPTTATLGSAADAILLYDAGDPARTPQTGTVGIAGDGSEIEIQLADDPGAWWRDRDVGLEVGPPLADLQGNLTAGVFTALFLAGGQGLTGGFLSGEAYDDATGRPLAVATASLFLAGAATPLAQVLTGARGRYVMTGDVSAGRYAVVLEKAGYTRVVRRLALEPSTGVVPFDVRLTPLAPSAGTLDPVHGGSVAHPDLPALALEAAPDGVAGDDVVTVTLTPLGGQGLPDFLPLGWTPAAAVDVRLSGAGGGVVTPFLPQSVYLELPLPSWVGSGDELIAARYHFDAGVWQTLPEPEYLGTDLVRIELVGPGTVAVLVADGDAATRPPIPELGGGRTLRGFSGAGVPELAADLVLTPPAIPPTGKAVARVVARSTDGVTAWPAGLAVQAYLEERLLLAGGGQLLEAPFSADLVLYHPRLESAEQDANTAGSAGAMEFVVSPSERAAQVLLEVGYETIRLFPFPEQVERGQVIGPAGGTVTSEDGLELSFPEGALGDKVVVEATLLDAGELAALPPVEGYTTLAAVRVDLSGASGERAATLGLDLPDATPEAIPGDPRLILGELIELPVDGRGSLVRLVARITRAPPAGGRPARLYAAPEPADSALALPGLRNEGLYLVLHAHGSIGFATGFVRAANGYGLAQSRVTAAGLGTANLSHEGGRYAAVAAVAGPVLTARHPTLDEIGVATIPVLAPGEIYPLDITVVPVPPAVAWVSPADGAGDQPITTTVVMRFSEPLDPAGVSSSTLRVEVADAAGEPTGAAVRGTTTLEADGLHVTFVPDRPLAPGTLFVARFDGGVSDLGGVRYQGPVPYLWTFTTSTVIDPSGQVDPGRFHVGIPSADGTVVVRGDAGALPGAGWSVVPYVEREVQDPVTVTVPANPDGSFHATIGVAPNPPVTIADRVWVKVLGPLGGIAAEFQVGPFTTPDGRGFVAPAGQAMSFTTADGIIVEVPAGAFDQATVVTVSSLDPGTLGVDLEPGMNVGAYVDVDFAGEANKSLIVKIPAPAGIRPDAQVFFGAPMDLSWGRRLRFLDFGGVVEEGGQYFFSNDSSFTPDLRDRKTAKGAQVPEGMCVAEAILMRFYLRSQAAAIYVDLVASVPPIGAFVGVGVAASMAAIYNAWADTFFYLPPPCDWDGDFVLPIAYGEPFQLVLRDLATGWITHRRDFDPIAYDGTGVARLGFLHQDDPERPMLIDASPFDVIRFATPAPGVSQRLRLEIAAEGFAGGTFVVRSVDGFELPAGAAVDLYDVAPAFPDNPEVAAEAPHYLEHVPILFDGTSWSSFEYEGSDDLMVIVTPGDLDPFTFDAFELQFDRRLSLSAQPGNMAKLLECGPLTELPSCDLEVPVEARLDAAETRLIVRPAGTLRSGRRYRLDLIPAEIWVDGNDGARLHYWDPAPTEFYFATRSIPGDPIGTMDGAPIDDPARDLMEFGNLVLAATQSGELYAVDVSEDRLAGVPGNYPIYATMYRGASSQVRAFATDGHNRLFLNVLYGGIWAIKALPIEDVRAATVTEPDVVRQFVPLVGGVRTAYALGAQLGSVAEYLALSTLPTATPVDLETIVQDEIVEIGELTIDDFVSNEPDDDGQYDLTYTLESSLIRGTDVLRAGTDCEWQELHDRFQRVTIDNLGTGQSWSFDVENPWPGGEGTGTREVTVKARPGDELRVRYNQRALGVVALLGSGITVVDLNRFYRLPGGGPVTDGSQCGRRLARYEGQFVDFGQCSFGGEHGIAMTPAVAAHGQTGCDAGGCARGVGFIDIYSPLLHTGATQTSAPAEKPSTLIPIVLACIRTFGGNEASMRDVALANDVSWYDRGVRFLPGPCDGGSTCPSVYSEGTFEVRDDHEPEQVRGDLLFVSLGDAGVLVFDVSERGLTASVLIGHLHVEGHAIHRLQVDAERGLLFAGGFDADFPIIDIWDVAQVNGETEGPQPIATLRGANFVTTNHIGVDPSGTGLIYTWDNEGLGATSVPFHSPRFAFAGLYRPDDAVDERVTPVARPSNYLVPLGIPLEPSVEEEYANRHENERWQSADNETWPPWEEQRPTSAAFKLRVALPGSLGEEVTAVVQSLRALPDERFLGEEDVGEAVAPPGGCGWPDTRVEVTLRRLAGETVGQFPGEAGRLANVYNLYESVDTVLLLADPRAQRDYGLPDGGSEEPQHDRATEYDQCRRCLWPSYLPDPDDADDVKELLVAGPYVRAYLKTAGNPALDAFFETQGDNYRKPSGYVEVVGWADEVVSPAQASLAEPVQNPAMWSPGEAGVSVSLAAGDAILAATDHQVLGRSLVVSLDRTYRSGIIGYGPLGSAGWNATIFAHLRELPLTDEVEYHDGQGNAWRFVAPVVPGSDFCPAGYEKDGNESYCAPAGLDLRLVALAEGGWRLVGKHHDVALFDRHGLLLELRDRLRRPNPDPQAQSSDPEGYGGNLRFVHDAFGQLIQITDDMGRVYQLEYDRDPQSPQYGLLKSMTDFADRKVEYEYFGACDRRLRKVFLPPVKGSGECASFDHGNPFLEYFYSDQTFGHAVPAHGYDFSRLRLRSYRLPQFLSTAGDRVEIAYDNQARTDDVTFVNATWDLDWSAASEVKVKAPWNHTVTYRLTNGRTHEIEERLPILPASVTYVDVGTQPTPTVLTTTFDYRPQDGRLKKTLPPDGSEIEYFYPGSGDRLGAGNVKRTVRRAGGAPTGPVTYSEIDSAADYDGDNLVKEITDPDDKKIGYAIPNAVGEEVRSGYLNDNVFTFSTFDVYGRPKVVQTATSTTAKADGDEIRVEVDYHPGLDGRPQAGFVKEIRTGDVRESFAYHDDDKGNVRRVTTSYGTYSEYGYDDWDRPIRELHGGSTAADFSPVNARVERAYDAAGHLVRECRFQQGVGWVKTDYEYNAREQVVKVIRDQVTGPDGNLVTAETVNSYDDHGRLEAVTSPGGVVTEYSFDSAGGVDGVEVGESGLQRKLRDAMGRVVFTTDGHEGWWRGQYDAWDRLFREETPTGAVTERTVSPSGAEVTEVVSSEDEELRKTRTKNTSFGAVEKLEVFIGDGTSLLTENAYDGSGRIETVTRGDRLEQTIEYEAASGKVKKTTDAAGNEAENVYENGCPWPSRTISREVPPEGGAAVETVTTDLDYDALGRVEREVTGGTTIERGFDEAGNLLWTTVGGGNRVDNTYDGHAILRTTHREATGLLVTHTHDLDARVRSTTVLRQNDVETTVLDYDLSGRLFTRQRPGSHQETFLYNPDDTLATWQTRLHVAGAPLTLKLHYDAANRLLERRVRASGPLPEGLAPLDYGDHYTYDPLSRPTRVARIVVDPGEGEADESHLDPASVVTFGDYDMRGLPKTETVGALGTLERGYDVFGRVRGVLLPQPAGGDVEQPGYGFYYDDLDRRIGVATADASGNPTDSSTFGATFTWGGTGRLYAVTSLGGLGVNHARAYANEGARLSGLTISVVGMTEENPVIGAFDFGWDVPRGLKQTRQATAAASVRHLTSSMSWTWSHDAAHRMTGARAGEHTTQPTTGATHPFSEWTFGYGRADELMSIQEVSSGLDLFDSGPEGRITGRHGQGEDVVFRYDDEGRRFEDDRFEYTWNWRGELVQVDVKADAPAHAGERVVYEYNANGRLLSRTHLGAPGAGGERSFIARRLFVWDGHTLAAEAGLNHAGQVIWRKQYAPGPGGLDDAPQVRVETGLPGTSSAKLYAFVRDEMGTVIGVMEDAIPTTPDQVPLLARYVYSPYGEAHLDQGPGLLSIEFDEQVTRAGGYDQDPPQPNVSVSGALLVHTTLPVDEDSLADGISVYRNAGGEWVEAYPDEFVVAPDDEDPSVVVVMRREGWYAHSHFRITLEPTLADEFARPIVLPAGESDGLHVDLEIPADGETPPSYAREFAFAFDSVQAAGATFGGAFPGGQNRLFQGLWTDPVSRVSYARNRWYDSRNASWLSEDPGGSVDSENLYAFVGWGPNMGMDPLGLEVTRDAAISFSKFIENVRKWEQEKYANKAVPLIERLWEFKKAIQSNKIFGSGGSYSAYKGGKKADTNRLGVHYIHTKTEGWIDLGHFSNAAGYAAVWPMRYLPSTETERIVKEGGYLVEVGQFASCMVTGLPNAEKTSAFTREDLRSNRLGAEFATYVRRYGSRFETLADAFHYFFWFNYEPSENQRLASDYEELPVSQEEIEARGFLENSVRGTYNAIRYGLSGLLTLTQRSRIITKAPPPPEPEPPPVGIIEFHRLSERIWGPLG